MTSPVQSPSSRDRTGEVLGRYRVQRMLGVGGMGSVYLAVDTTDQRSVALKVLHDSVLRDRSARMRFIREAQAAAAVVHPCVAAVFEINELDDDVFIALEYVDGQTLRSVLDSGPMALQDALRIAREIALALSHAHAAGIIHRDLKPENLMLDARGVLKILDFGLAKQTGALPGHDVSSAPTIFTTGEGVILGTPSYMAPEQIRGRPVDARADIFSLGVILYEMVTGARPFRGASAMEILIATARDELTPPSILNPRAPVGLDLLLARCLAKLPEDRTPSADELAAGLDELLVADCEAELASPTPTPTTPGEARPRRGELALPHGLVGREPLLEQLLAAVDRASRGEVLLVLVHGDTGLGKSTLLAALREPVTTRGGQFAAGKFDHLARGAPLAPLAEALRAVARHVASEPAEARDRWLSDLAEATGPNRHVLDDMIPELHGLLGPPPRATSAEAGEAKNRFHAAFQRLVRLFAARSPPLVLALDDLHGADPSALALLELLLTDPAGGHLMVVASARDVTDDSHPLRMFQDSLRRLGATVVDLAAAPLQHADVVRFVADALGCSPDDAAPLARVLDLDARGNPALLRHLLLGLRRDGQLRFDSGVGRWTWDIRTPAHRSAGDVAAFLANKLQRLSPGVQRVLAIAACAGRPVDLATLSAIDGRNPVRTAHDLREALREGLLVHTDGEDEPTARRARYRPLHDGIHQAAYALLTPAARAQIHLQVGRQLLQAGEDLFTAIDHFQRGVAALEDPVEREQLARIYLEAARRARAQTAYAAAVRHARAGIAALEAVSPDIWTSHRGLAFRLHRERMHADAMHGDLASADALFAAIAPRAPDELERADLHRLKTQLDTYHGRTQEAILTGLAGLRRLGVDLQPRPDAALVEADALALAAAFAAVADADPGDFDDAQFDHNPGLDVGAADTATNLRIQYTTTEPELSLEPGSHTSVLEILLARRETADPLVATVAELLAATAPAAMFTDTRLAYRLYMHLVHLWLQHGPTRVTAYGLAGYGLYLAGGRRDFAGAFVFGQLALRLRDRMADPAQGARMLHIVGGLIMGWTQPFTAAAATLERGYQVGVQTGDFVAATYNATTVMLVLLASRRSASHMRATAEQLLLTARPILAVYGSGIIRVILRTARCLAGELPSPEFGPVDRWAAEVFDAELAHETTPLPLLYLHISRSIVLYHFGRHEVPPLHPAAAERFSALLTPMAIDVYFYRVLHRCADITAEPDLVAAHAAIAADIAELESLADLCPVNFEARARIAAAEYERVCGKLDAAEARFKVAIRAARKHGELGSEALAHELAGRLALVQGDDIVGLMHLRTAVQAYHRWGAPAVAQRLIRLHHLDASDDA